MIHLVGKYGLRNAFQQKRAVVTSEEVDATLKGIGERGADGARPLSRRPSQPQNPTRSPRRPRGNQCGRAVLSLTLGAESQTKA